MSDSKTITKNAINGELNAMRDNIHEALKVKIDTKLNEKKQDIGTNYFAQGLPKQS